MPNNKSFENIKLFKAFGFSAYKIRDLQTEHNELGHLIQYLKNGERHRTQKRARILLFQSDDYCLIDGLLFHSRISESK